ncbi:hypothetical protein KKF55_06465 [Patescibacteria group bacterium]|nr:hypothetical protein [Patescibacteria group bacterium]
MKHLHLPSYLIGLGCGVTVLLLFFGAKAALSTSSTEDFPQNENWQQRTQEDGMRPRVGDETQRTQRMAESFGMTVEDLQKELDSGKTMMEIAEEREVEMPMRPQRAQDDAAEEESGSGSANPEPTQQDDLQDSSLVPIP